MFSKLRRLLLLDGRQDHVLVVDVIEFKIQLHSRNLSIETRKSRKFL